MMGTGLIPVILLAALPSGYADVEARHGASKELRSLVLELYQSRGSQKGPSEDAFLTPEMAQSLNLGDPDVVIALFEAVLGHLVVTETGATTQNGVLSFGLACSQEKCEKNIWKIQSVDGTP